MPTSKYVDKVLNDNIHLKRVQAEMKTDRVKWKRVVCYADPDGVGKDRKNKNIEIILPYIWESFFHQICRHSVEEYCADPKKI